MDRLLAGLRAAGEPTRLRLLSLCAHGDLTVSELTQILGQSQPRVSRHLKLMCEAGLLDRFPEGAWVFYRQSDRGSCADLARTLVDLTSAADPILARDLERLETVRRSRAEQAAAYFRANAARWNAIRALYIDEAAVERTVLELLGEGPVQDYLDVGTGTGRLLQLLAPRVRRGIGVDLSKEMLNVARANLERNDLRHCQVRHGDMYSLPLANHSVDLVTLHLVLHYADDPAGAIAEAARVLRPEGRLMVVDFTPHDQEFLRTEHAHRRLGFRADELAGWYRSAGLDPDPARTLDGEPLTVAIWPATKSTTANGKGYVQ